jgi:hypothetical protein
MTEGSLKYQVVVQICSLFDGVIPEMERAKDGAGLGQLLEEINGLGEEELNRQVYEDDAFILCLGCKETFMEEIYSRLRPEATPENGRAHLIH